MKTISESQLRLMIRNVILEDAKLQKEILMNEGIGDFAKSTKSKVLAGLIAMLASYNLLNPDMSEEEIKQIVATKIENSKSGSVQSSKVPVAKKDIKSKYESSKNVFFEGEYSSLGRITAALAFVTSLYPKGRSASSSDDYANLNYVKHAEDLDVEMMFKYPRSWDVEDSYFEPDEFLQKWKQLSQYNRDGDNAKAKKAILQDARHWQDVSERIDSFIRSETYTGSHPGYINPEMMGYVCNELGKENSHASNALYSVLKISPKGEEAWNSGKGNGKEILKELANVRDIAEKYSEILKYVAKSIK